MKKWVPARKSTFGKTNPPRAMAKQCANYRSDRKDALVRVVHCAPRATWASLPPAPPNWPSGPRGQGGSACVAVLVQGGGWVAHRRKIAVIGLGYVGLPVAVAFARSGAPVIAFDIDRMRIDELRSGHDRTREVDASDLNIAALQLRPPIRRGLPRRTSTSSPCRRRSTPPAGPTSAPCWPPPRPSARR